MHKWNAGIIAVIAIDQITKMMALASLPLYQEHPVMPFVNLTRVHNVGAAFGLLRDAGGWQRWLFIVLGVGVSLYFYRWMKREEQADIWLAAGLSLIIGGAVGNIIDRIFRGYVVDFIDVYYQTYHWPVFNIADSAIVGGAMILILSCIREPK